MTAKRLKVAVNGYQYSNFQPHSITSRSQYCKESVRVFQNRLFKLLTKSTKTKIIYQTMYQRESLKLDTFLSIDFTQVFPFVSNTEKPVGRT